MNIMNKKAQFLPGLDEINPIGVVLAVAGAIGTFWYMGRFYESSLAMEIFASILMLPIGYFVSSYILER